MLLNPIVWFMMNFGSSALGIDGQLASQGVLTPAVVTDVMRYPGRNGHTDVSYYYKFDGHIYSKQEQRSNGPTFAIGDKHAVVVLPSNPTVTESLDSPAGKKRDTDVLFFVVAALANLGILTAFLYPSIIHKNLAMRGKAYVAKIDSLKLIDKTTCKVDVVFHVDGHPTFKSTSVSVDEYHTLRTGKWEIILFDEKTQDLVFYRFCRYVPTSTNSKITTTP